MSTCDNYPPPNTCLSAQTPLAIRCDHCWEQAEADHAEERLMTDERVAEVIRKLKAAPGYAPGGPIGPRKPPSELACHHPGCDRWIPCRHHPDAPQRRTENGDQQ